MLLNAGVDGEGEGGRILHSTSRAEMEGRGRAKGRKGKRWKKKVRIIMVISGSLALPLFAPPPTLFGELSGKKSGGDK